MMEVRVHVVSAACALCMTVAPVTSAQDLSGRVALELAASVRMVAEPDGHASPAVVFDVSGGLDLSHRTALIVRPVVYGTEGAWDASLYQALLRVQGGSTLTWRVDGGYMTPPIGIATFDARPDRNPTLLPPFARGQAIGSLEGGAPPVELLSPRYPLGVQAAASTARWDARVAVTDSSAARARAAFGDPAPARAPQLTVGGGLTPAPGVRVGGAWSAGRYAHESETADGLPRSASFANVEFDWSGGYGRVYGEWIRGSFERAGPRAVTHALTITAVRTLAPRWFIASRLQSVRVPDRLTHAPYVHDEPAAYGGTVWYERYGEEEYGAGYGPATAADWSTEAALGMRVSPELALRAGYIGYRGIDGDRWEHAAGVSLTWSRRWW